MMRFPAWFRGLRLDGDASYALTEADRKIVSQLVNEQIVGELDEWESLIAKVKIVLRLVDLADEASASYYLGEIDAAHDALARYHALRCEHAVDIDILGIPDS